MSRVEDSSSHGPIHVRSHWEYLRTKLKRRGVVEVNNSHPHHDMLSAVQSGLRELFKQYPEVHGKEELTDADYTQSIKLKITSPKNKSYTFESYASAVFGCVRAAVDVSDEDYLENLSPSQIPQLPYLEFISNSRSGQDFYFSNNQQFILKTDHEHCVEFFLSILRDYLDHFLTYPHSLLVKFLGLYSIKPARGTKKYLLVMQSVFYPTMRVEERFDIKGCLVNRYQNPNPSGKKTVLVLKDQNFLQEHIELGRQSEWFRTQLRADVDFLLSLGVQDYSLLLGRHPLHALDKRESVSNLMVRIKKSFGHDQTTIPVMPEADSPEPEAANQTNNGVQDGNVTKLEPEIVSSTNVHTEGVTDECHQSGGRNKVSPSKTDSHNQNTCTRTERKTSKFLKSLSNQSYLDSTGLHFQNRRLLLNCENNLHVIDGVKYRYYVGIIDFFTQFRCRQRVGKILKDMKTCCGNHSTEPPDKYGERFYEFLSEKIV